jgi:hypothetical protein
MLLVNTSINTRGIDKMRKTPKEELLSEPAEEDCQDDVKQSSDSIAGSR